MIPYLPPPPFFSSRLGIFQNVHKTKPLLNKLTKVNKNKTTHERANQPLASHSQSGEEPASLRTTLAHLFSQPRDVV